jgi:hypothetical protein
MLTIPAPVADLPDDASRLIAETIALALPYPALSPEWRAIRDRFREAMQLQAGGGFIDMLCRELGWPTFGDLRRADAEAAEASSELARAFVTLAEGHDAEAAEAAANDPQRRFYAELAEDFRRAIFAPLSV